MSLHLLTTSNLNLSEFLADIFLSLTCIAGWASGINRLNNLKAHTLIKILVQTLLLITTIYHIYLFINHNLFTTSQLSYSLIILASIISIFGIILLGEKNLHKTHTQPLIILVFTWATIYMVSAENILSMFLAFELMFFPSAYYVYLLGYSKQSTKSVVYLAIWTYIGSFICLVGIAYIYTHTSSLHLQTLSTFSFSGSEKRVLTVLFIVGFGVKIPLWPFYYWLIKVHVDSPTGFSIFLSGFLVKTALFCLLRLLTICPAPELFLLFATWFLYGIFDASCRMWETVDIKKLIALATVQEMNILVLLAFLLKNSPSSTFNCFIILHGVISTLFFLLVDSVYKITGSRQITQISGLAEVSPKLAAIVWTVLVAFRGLPLFVKFYIESDLLITLSLTVSFLTAAIFLVASFIGIISFFRLWFSGLYGTVNLKKQQFDITANQLTLLIAGIFTMLSLTVILNF